MFHECKSWLHKFLCRQILLFCIYSSAWQNIDYSLTVSSIKNILWIHPFFLSFIPMLGLFCDISKSQWWHPSWFLHVWSVLTAPGKIYIWLNFFLFVHTEQITFIFLDFLFWLFGFFEMYFHFMRSIYPCLIKLT